MSLKIAFILFFISIISYSQESSKKRNDLKASVIKVGTSSFDAAKASRDCNLAIIIHHGKNDTISGKRYAKGFAKGFAISEKTASKPIYITAVYKNNAYAGSTFVEIFINGQKWDYKNNFQLSPNDAGYLLPTVMKEFVKKCGWSKIIKYK